MDIVDAFTHLIPEHLDDALFLGSNLENEGCDDFIQTPHVIEDSLKNMLSDKDPMLGSASTQFCLPVLDSADPNFKLTCATVVGLDDIMDEACVKESDHVTIDEDDLLLPSRNVKHRMDTGPVKSSRKSPRLTAQEPVRSLRQSTVAKRSNTAPVTSPKKIPAESEPTPAVVQKGETNMNSSDLIKSESEDFLLKVEHHKVLRRSSRRISQSEQGTEVLLPLGKKSRTGDNEMKKEANAEVKSETNLQEESDVKSDVLSCCSPVLDSQPPSEELKSHIESVTGTPFEHVQSNNIQTIDMVKKETHVDLMATTTQSGGDGDYQIDEIVNSVGESSGSESPKMQSDRTLVNLREGNDEIALSSGTIGGETECSPWIEATVESMVTNAELIKECNLENLEGAKDGNKNTILPKCLATVELTRLDKNNTCSSDKVETSVSPQDIHLQEVAQSKDGKPVKKTGKAKVEGGTKSLKSMKKIKSKPTKSVVPPLKNVGAKEKCTSALKDMTDKATHTIHVKVVRPVRKQSPVKARLHTSEPLSQPSVRPGKGRKMLLTKAVKKQSSAAKDKVATKKTSIVLKKSKQNQNDQKQLIHISNDKSKSHPSSPSESRSSLSMHLLHTHSPTEHTGHSNQRQIQKQQSAPLKASDQAKDEGEAKDPVGIERSKEEEKLKLKKGLPPRQRRSSKSVSLDEPPLFIPDNISAVKKDGAENVSQGDSKNVWLHGKQCLSCKKNHVHRFMVGCGRCDDWFHGECVGLSLPQAQEMRDDGKEYICLKCSADEEKKLDSYDQSISDNQDKAAAHIGNRTIEYEKSALPKETLSSVPSVEKSKQVEELVKNRVKTFRKDSSDRSAPEGRESECKKVHGTPVRKTLQTHGVTNLSSEEKNDKLPKHHTPISLLEEKSSKSGPLEKQEAKKKKTEKRVQVSSPATPPAPKQSVEQIRQSVRHTLKDILLKRLSESSSKIPEERAAKVAMKIEKELFSFYRDIDSKYKSKYRSLTFNLRDPKNNVLYKRVLKGDVSAEHLIKMSPEELASKELAAWRQRENRHTIEMIEKEEREKERRPITKITHKGEIEIESETSLKEAEAMESEEPTAAKPVEKVEEMPKEKEVAPESTSDTTNQHKVHLFDLNCKICTGRMAPPSDDLSPKKVKVSIAVVRKHSDNEAESMEEDIASALSTASSILSSDILEAEKPESPKTTISSPVRSEKPVAGENEAAFLARLTYIWKGIVNMPSVAKFVIKAYPVSGSVEYLTEDLPDSIQVGGRISPQTVWDYVEKIKATGTKETCLIRFCPVTEEDQISYTLLYAYFSSRRRYGVVANNTKQVKDMYLIPLGASEKVPRILAPFDGPGLEAHRPNLLLALIIRQKLKRSHSTSLDEESLGNTTGDVTPEKKMKKEISNEEEGEEEEDEEENEFFNSFTTVLHKSRNRSQDSDTDESQTVEEPVPVKSKSEPPKPLRFLPGVLVGWENQSSTLELANKPLPVDDILQSLLGSTENIFESSEMSEEKSVSNEAKRAIELTNDKISEKKAKLDDSQESTEVKKTVQSPVVSSLYATRTVKGLSLKGKPHDISTEAFLSKVASVQSHGEEFGKNKERETKYQLDDQQDILHEAERTDNSSFSASTSGKVNMDNAILAPAETTQSTKFFYVKRDPRQAAGRKQPVNASDQASDCSRNQESQHKPCLETYGEKGPHHTDSLKSELRNPLSANRGTDHLSSFQKEGSKQLQGDTLLQNMETLPSYGRGPEGVATHLETVTTLQNDIVSKDQSSTTGEMFSPIRHPPPLFQSPRSCPSLIQFQSPPNYHPVYGFPPHTPPPLLPTGYGFPRGPPLRFRSLDAGLQSPMIPWPPGVNLSGYPTHYMGPLSQGLPLAPGQSRYLEAPQLYHRDDCIPGRRHSDPWDSQDLYLERDFSRDGEVQRRQRFYSDSHNQRKKRLHEKESSNEKYRDRDSERNRRRERDRSQEKDRERKSRDETHRDKDRSRVSRSDRNTDSKTHKESKNSEKHGEKSKHEHTRERDKEREKSRERTKEGEKDKERHHKEKEESDRVKHKR